MPLVVIRLERRVDLEPTDSDSVEFTSEVAQLITSVVSATSPAVFYVVKVDNWFGPKWLAFSHKVMGAFGVASRDLVVPPFVPNRIVSEVIFTLANSGEYEKSDASKPIHVEQVSSANAGRKLSILLPNAALFWWSGQSATNGRGSLMAYLPTPDGHVPWYIELAGQETWGPSVTKGISSSELQSYQSQASASGAV
jgi:hypothetical protein